MKCTDQSNFVLRLLRILQTSKAVQTMSVLERLRMQLMWILQDVPSVPSHHMTKNVFHGSKMGNFHRIKLSNLTRKLISDSWNDFKCKYCSILHLNSLVSNTLAELDRMPLNQLERLAESTSIGSLLHSKRGLCYYSKFWSFLCRFR